MNFPAGHFEQSVELFEVEYCPGGHEVHDDDISGEYVPGSQTEQLDWPAALLNLPAAQFMQL